MLPPLESFKYIDSREMRDADGHQWTISDFNTRRSYQSSIDYELDVTLVSKDLCINNKTKSMMILINIHEYGISTPSAKIDYDQIKYSFSMLLENVLNEDGIKIQFSRSILQCYAGCLGWESEKLKIVHRVLNSIFYPESAGLNTIKSELLDAIAKKEVLTDSQRAEMIKTIGDDLLKVNRVTLDSYKQCVAKVKLSDEFEKRLTEIIESKRYAEKQHIDDEFAAIKNDMRLLKAQFESLSDVSKSALAALIPLAKIKQYSECVLCNENPLNCANIRCGHVATCIDCMKKCASCPMCRGPVDNYIKIHVA